jgi:hypothetical protein
VLAIAMLKLVAQAVNDILTWAQREREQEQQEQEQEKEAGQWGSQRQEGEC